MSSFADFITFRDNSTNTFYSLFMYTVNEKIPSDKVGFFDKLDSINNYDDLTRMTRERSSELGFNCGGDPAIIASPKYGYIILLNNKSRAEEYAVKNEAQSKDPNTIPFQATGNRSMLAFQEREYLGVIKGTSFIAAVNYKPFHPEAGILIPKPILIDGDFIEKRMTWKHVTIKELTDLQELSLKGLAIWNAMSSPSSPYLHFQYIPDVIRAHNLDIELPLSSQISCNGFDSDGLYFNKIRCKCSVTDNPVETLNLLNLLENYSISSDLIISRGHFICVPKRRDKFIINYPWGLHWKPTAERLGLIFFHYSMEDAILDTDQFIYDFWSTNNDQVYF